LLKHRIRSYREQAKKKGKLDPYHKKKRVFRCIPSKESPYDTYHQKITMHWLCTILFASVTRSLIPFPVCRSHIFQLLFLPLGKPTQPRGRPEASTRSCVRSRIADLQCAALAPCERVTVTRFPNSGSGSIAARLIGGGCLLDGAALYSMVCIPVFLFFLPYFPGSKP